MEPSAVKLADEAPHVVNLEILERCIACQIEERLDVAGVIRARMRAQTPLVREMCQEPFHQFL